MKFSYVVAAVLLYVLYTMYYRPTGEFKENKFELGVAFTAKNYCSCLFVVENSKETCLDYASLDIVSPKLSADFDKKTTTSTFFFFVSRQAQFLDSDRGCVLL